MAMPQLTSRLPRWVGPSGTTRCSSREPSPRGASSPSGEAGGEALPRRSTWSHSERCLGRASRPGPSAQSLAPQGLPQNRANPPLMAVAIKPRSPSTAAKPGADKRFESLLLDFLAYLELERGLSRSTLNAYRTDLLQYGEYLSAHKRDALEASAADVADFLAELATGEGRPACSAATIHRKAACLRSFYKHLRRDELIADDPTAALSAPRRSKKLPHVLNYSEVQKLLASPTGSEPTALRDRALLEVMYACGLRASETIGLELGDVDLREGVLRARGKGSKERLGPPGPQGVAPAHRSPPRGAPQA